MITVTSDMIFRAVVASSLLGVISGTIYALMRVFSSLFCAILSRIFKGKNESFKRICKHAVFANICDYVFVLVVGIAYILILYALTDGVFYLLTLVTLCGSFIAGNSTVLSISKIRKR